MQSVLGLDVWSTTVGDWCRCDTASVVSGPLFNLIISWNDWFVCFPNESALTGTCRLYHVLMMLKKGSDYRVGPEYWISHRLDMLFAVVVLRGLLSRNFLSTACTTWPWIFISNVINEYTVQDWWFHDTPSSLSPFYCIFGSHSRLQ